MRRIASKAKEKDTKEKAKAPDNKKDTEKDGAKDIIRNEDGGRKTIGANEKAEERINLRTVWMKSPRRITRIRTKKSHSETHTHWWQR